MSSTPTATLDRQAVFTRNHVRITGRPEGRPMVFAHGFGCDQTMWRFVTPAFEEDFRIVLFDYVGCGKSDWSACDPGRYGTLHGYAADLVEILEAADLRDAIFVGHSVSAMIGLLASLRAPGRISRAVLVGPSPSYIDDGDYVGGFKRPDIEGLLDLMDKNYLGWASFLAPMVVKSPAHPELVQELRDSFCAMDPRLARAFARATFLSDNRADLAKVTVPSLILQCSDDSIAPMAVGNYVHHELRGSTLRVLEATGHAPHMSHPSETIRAMKEYLGA